MYEGLRTLRCTEIVRYFVYVSVNTFRVAELRFYCVFYGYWAIFALIWFYLQILQLQCVYKSVFDYLKMKCLIGINGYCVNIIIRTRSQRFEGGSHMAHQEFDVVGRQFLALHL